MNTPRSPSQPLNYFQQSPVRGQLESPDGQYARSGWRYLQCTDTPNELRVLLPPRTALIYNHLLRAELIELRKDRDAAWDRILQIRHLKDRMIRKCQRLGRESAPTGKPSPRSMFFTVHAPPDFRLKEMERWFREQGAHFGSDVAQGHSRTPYCCNKCMPSAHMNHQGSLSRRPSAQAHRHAPPPDRVPARRGDSVTHTTTTLLNPSPPLTSQHPKRQPPQGYKSPGRVPAVVRDPGHVSPHRKTMERKRSAGSDVSIATRSTRLNAKSPDPLPIPFRMHDPDEEAALVDSPGSSQDEMPSTSPEPEPEPEPLEAPALPALNGQLPTILEASEGQASVAGEDAHRAIPRRRSSLKRAGSISRLSIASQTKSVAWAMDRDWIEQMSQYMKTANEAEVLGHELEVLRVDYHKEVDAMKRMCRGVSEASERIRLEMEKLHRDEEAVRRQEDRLLHTIEQLERKETQFRDKGMSCSNITAHMVG
ncbi:uncharacterized protein B0H18DRAFT_949996 [Fomitopsis serialis]|uniref:uncharacterized protein n=1 Tax=Fomitopsis serialis TaxID=139415 RepID=UPI0020080325|nr:uncharacterized protein B0H18DRAFT_949996 [Neoantrodia serialis]KAH9936992.1 hypothetical protein B0H18DRAFT_949996 [Neoantrodia serialis]